MKKTNICIVDDDKIYQFTMKLSLRHIENIGEISYFNEGLEAIDFILENRNDSKKLPDIIFLDINMPVMDGYQFIEEYRKVKSKLCKEITIYMLSSSIDPIDLGKVKNIDEVSSYYTKPIQREALKDLFQSLN